MRTGEALRKNEIYLFLASGVAQFGLGRVQGFKSFRGAWRTIIRSTILFLPWQLMRWENNRVIKENYEGSLLKILQKKYEKPISFR